VEVDADGYVSVPYAGRIKAAGATPDDVASRIEGALSGQSQNPQVIVTISKNLADTVIVSGAVKSPGRFPLTLANEQLLDMVAIAGGPTHGDEDESVQLTRAGQSAELPLTELESDATQNVYLDPGDHIQLSYNPRSYTVFGAAEKVEQISFDAPKLTLAEALARAGGPADGQADPNGIFLFRFERPAVAARLGLQAAGAKVPVIYQLDMMQPASYFVAQEFAMQDQDVLYIANAKTDKVSKFLGLVGAVVAPASTATNLAQ
jgi:polysaccharide export outer membrane protein